ncbi:hypothetical protein [Spongiactinospora sp. TRM90649]|uniref:hypothetical protein n=1 Tax=Spongiactinospora sp. TRM90649 TaxID=3031114 RepID=UPI0023F75AF8|nr:hypothetical protein [Spongiactinospora sp. TRM90649]MDF5759402.1 hypothetical protein [Spongiactinospora sp. TRM90649]
MTIATATTVLLICSGILAVATFLIQGRQWPTAIAACVFGLFLASTPVGDMVTDALVTLLRSWS